MIYNNADELIEDALRMEDLLYVYNVINLGEAVYQDILRMQESTFSSKYFKGVLPRIRTAAICTQFEAKFLSKDFPFKSASVEVNAFKYMVPELSNNKVIMHIARVQHSYELPLAAKYKVKKAELNNFKQKQMFYTDLKIPKSDNERYYALITYGGKRKIEFINLIIPDMNYKNIEGYRDLTNLSAVSKNKKVDTEENMIKRRMRLKEEVLKKIQVQGV